MKGGIKMNSSLMLLLMQKNLLKRSNNLSGHKIPRTVLKDKTKEKKEEYIPKHAKKEDLEILSI